MESNRIDVNLIDTSFDRDDAMEVLLSLVDYKIRFHQRKRFSNEERFAKDIHHSEKRILELKAERKRVVEHFSKLNKDARIEINGKVIVQEEDQLEVKKTA